MPSKPAATASAASSIACPRRCVSTQLDVAVRLERPQRRAHRALPHARGNGIDDQAQAGSLPRFSVPRSAARASRGTRRRPPRGRACATAAACSCASSSITSASVPCSAARSRRFVQAERQRRAGRELRGERLRGRQQLVARQHALHETELERLGGSDAARRGGELEGTRVADDARQQPGAAAVGHERDVRERHHQHRFLGHVAQVAGQREREARAGRGAVDGGDDRLGHADEALHDRDVGLADRPRRRPRARPARADPGRHRTRARRRSARRSARPCRPTARADRARARAARRASAR